MAFIRVYIRMADVIMRLDTRVRLNLVVNACRNTNKLKDQSNCDRDVLCWRCTHVL